MSRPMHPYRVPENEPERPERRVRSGLVVLLTVIAWLVVSSDIGAGWRGLVLLLFVGALAVLAFLDRAR